MNNKPKYHLFKNTKYALDGFISTVKNESSFRLELIVGIFIFTAIVLIDTTITMKVLLAFSAILVLVVELINSAIENVVDLVTKEHHQLAKNAKDMGASAVMMSILLHLGIWVVVLFI